jgi:uncharacterized protein YoxC
MAQTASIRLTLTNIATEEDINNLEERIMSALSDAVAQIKAAVSNLSVAQSPEKVSELEAALQAERDANAAALQAAAELASAEELEDSEQNQALQDAKAQTDALLAEMNSAATDLQGVSAQLSSLGTAVDDAPDEMPVGEVPVDIPAPDAEVQSPPASDSVIEPAPAEGDGGGEGEGSTPAPSSGETTDVGVSPDGGAPSDAAPDVIDAGPITGPTDSSGRPIDGPNL